MLFEIGNSVSHLLNIHAITHTRTQQHSASIHKCVQVKNTNQSFLKLNNLCVDFQNIETNLMLVQN